MKLIGLDVGTTGCKAVVFDAAGEVLGRGFREYGIATDGAGRAEQNAEQVWALTCEALTEAVARSGREDLRALSLSAQGDAIIPVTDDFRPLHPAILGMDYRSAEQADRCADLLGAAALFQRTGMRPHPMNSLVKVLWLRETAPAVFHRTEKIVTYADFILGKLGGEAVIDHPMASRTMAFDLAAGGWSPEIHNALGLDPSLWSRAVPSGTRVGLIRHSVAEALGLPTSLTLVAGGHDQTCAALGAGGTRERMGVVSTGTAEVLATPLGAPVLSAAMFENFYPCYRYVQPGMFFTFTLNHAGGASLRWWRDEFGADETAEALQRRISAYAVLDERLPEGPSPVMFLPHLNGSGTPRCDLQSKGAVVGLTLATRRADVAKALLEGLAFELKLNLEALERCGIAIPSLVAVGGGARSVPWLQLKADILNRPLHTTRCPEAACLGAALLAGTAVGAYANLAEAADRTVRIERTFEPASEPVAAYQERYALYRELYPAVRTIHERL